jgi:hypothetical protein
MHHSKGHHYSITSSARARSVATHAALCPRAAEPHHLGHMKRRPPRSVRRLHTGRFPVLRRCGDHVDQSCGSLARCRLRRHRSIDLPRPQQPRPANNTHGCEPHQRGKRARAVDRIAHPPSDIRSGYSCLRQSRPAQAFWEDPHRRGKSSANECAGSLSTGLAGCRARAASGHAVTAPPRSVAKNFRRPMWLAM